MCWELGSAERALLLLLLALVSVVLALVLGATDGVAAAAAGCRSFLRLLEVSRVVAAGHLSSAAAAAGDAAGVLTLLVAGVAVLEGMRRGARKALRLMVLLPPLLLLVSLPVQGAAGPGSLKGLLGLAGCAGSWDKGKELSAGGAAVGHDQARRVAPHLSRSGLCEERQLERPGLDGGLHGGGCGLMVGWGVG